MQGEINTANDIINYMPDKGQGRVKLRYIQNSKGAKQ